MRASTHRIATTLAILATIPTGRGQYTGKNAEQMPVPEALRLASRLERARSGGQSMSLAAIVHKSSQRRRAAQTHPHKRR